MSRLDSAASSGGRVQKKLESTVAEFNHLLSFHLREQRKFYEDRYEEERSDLEEVTASLRLEREQQVRALRNLEHKVREMQIEIELCGKRQRQALQEETKIGRQHEMLEKLNKTISDKQQSVVDQDKERLKHAEERKKAALAEQQELKQQINDMKTHIRMQLQSARAGVGSSDGGVMVVTESSGGEKKGSTRGGRRKRK